jgi:hypothetical protein
MACYPLGSVVSLAIESNEDRSCDSTEVSKRQEREKRSLRELDIMATASRPDLSKERGSQYRTPPHSAQLLYTSIVASENLAVPFDKASISTFIRLY